MARHLLLIFFVLVSAVQIRSQEYGVYYDLATALNEPERVVKLDLSNSGLTSIPEDIKLLTYLESLDLSNNDLSSLPDQLIDFKFLNELDLSGNSRFDASSLFELLEQLRGLKSLKLKDCDLRYLSAGLVNLSLLETLDVSGNNLANLPKSYTRLKNLKELNLAANNLSSVKPGEIIPRTLSVLDISGNPGLLKQETLVQLSGLTNLKSLSARGLSEIPYELMLLEQITHIDLSNGQFRSLPDRARLWRNLQFIQLNNCEKVNWSDFLEKLAYAKNLETIEIKSNKLLQLPLGLAENKKLSKVVLSGNKMQLLPPDIGRLKRLNELVLMETPSLELDKVFQQLEGNQIIQTLRILNGVFEVLPANVHFLKDLKVLDLRGNLFDQSLITLCENILFGCLIEFDTSPSIVESRKACNKVLNPSRVDIEISNSSGGKVTLPSGTIVSIKDSSFVNQDEEVIDTLIDFKFAEIKHPVEAYFSGLFDGVISDPEIEYLQYAGIFNLIPSDDDSEIRLGNNKNIGIEWGSQDGHMNLNLWRVDEQGQNLNKIGRDELVLKVNKKSKESVQDFEGMSELPVSPVEPSALRKENIKVTVKNRRNEFVFKIEPVESDAAAEFVSSNDQLYKSYPELSTLEDITWRYDGFSNEEDLQKMDLLSSDVPRTAFTEIYPESEPSESYLIEDFIVKPDRENDNYLLRFYTPSGIFELSAYPLFGGKDLSKTDQKSDQKRNRQFYRSYSKLHRDRKKEWGRADSLYRIQNDEFKVKMDEFRKEMDLFSGMVAPGAGLVDASPEPHRRKTRVPEFGSYIIGKSRSFIGEEFTFLFTDEEGNVIFPNEVVAFDETNNLVYKVNGNKSQIDPAARISFVAHLDDQRIGIFSNSQFRKLKVDPSIGKTVLKFNILTNAAVTSNRIRHMYNINN